jgi:hypothetical protein
MDKCYLLNKQAVVMPGSALSWFNPIMGDTFISSFVPPSVLSFLILASWAS